MIQTNKVLFIEKLKVVPNSSILELHMQDVCNLIVYVFECRNHISISTHEQSFKRTKDFLRQRKALLWRQVFPMGRGEILLIATIRECIGMLSSNLMPWVYTGFRSFLHFQSCQKLSDVSNEEVIKFNFVQQRISPEGFRVVMLAVSIKDLLSLNVGKQMILVLNLKSIALIGLWSNDSVSNILLH